MTSAAKNTILIVSLLVNLFVIGFIAGGAFGGLKIVRSGSDIPHPDWEGPPPGAHIMGSPMRFLAELPPERRDAIREATRGRLKQMRPQFREMRDARTELFAALSEDPIDSERVRAASERLTSLEGDVKRAGHEAILAVLSELTPEERAAALERIGERGGRFLGEGHRPGWRGGPGGHRPRPEAPHESMPPDTPAPPGTSGSEPGEPEGDGN